MPLTMEYERPDRAMKMLVWSLPTVAKRPGPELYDGIQELRTFHSISNYPLELE